MPDGEEVTYSARTSAISQTIHGTTRADSVWAGDGEDHVAGYSEDDSLSGGTGNDVVMGDHLARSSGLQQNSSPDCLLRAASEIRQQSREPWFLHPSGALSGLSTRTVTRSMSWY